MEYARKKNKGDDMMVTAVKTIEIPDTTTVDNYNLGRNHKNTETTPGFIGWTVANRLIHCVENSPDSQAEEVDWR